MSRTKSILYVTLSTLWMWLIKNHIHKKSFNFFKHSESIIPNDIIYFLLEYLLIIWIVLDKMPALHFIFIQYFEDLDISATNTPNVLKTGSCFRILTDDTTIQAPRHRQQLRGEKKRIRRKAEKREGLQSRRAKIEGVGLRTIKVQEQEHDVDGGARRS